MVARRSRLFSCLAFGATFLLGCAVTQLPSKKLSEKSSSYLKPFVQQVLSYSTKDPLDFNVPLRFKPGAEKQDGRNYSRTLVIPRIKFDNVDWTLEKLKDIEVVIYDVEHAGDSCTGKYCVPVNKGREAMVSIFPIVSICLAVSVASSDPSTSVRCESVALPNETLAPILSSLQCV
jgi:hypothetical protein